MADDLWGKSVTPAQNNQTPPEGMPEGMQAGQVNDSWRENTAFLRRYIADLCAEDGAGNVLDTAGTGSAYTLTVQQQFTTLRPGMRFLARAHAQNTGACTLTVTPAGQAALTAKSIKLSGNLDPKAGDILTGQLVEFSWNNTGDYFEITTPVTAALLPFWQGTSLEAADKTLTESDDGTLVLMDGSTAAVTITLPTTPRDGATFGFVAYNVTNTLTISRGGTDQIAPESEGGTKVNTITLGNIEQFVTLSYYSGLWYVMAGDRIGTARIKDKAVSIAKMADEAGAGALCYNDSGVASRIASAAGDSGKILTVGSTGTPEWAAGSGGLELIETRTVSSTVTNLDFSGLSDYYEVHIEYECVPVQSGRFQALLGDSAGFTSGNMAYRGQFDNFGATGGTSTEGLDYSGGSGSGQNPQVGQPCSGVLIFDGISGKRTVMSFNGAYATTGAWASGSIAVNGSPTYGDIEQIRLQRRAGGNWISSGTFNVYGLRRPT